MLGIHVVDIRFDAIDLTCRGVAGGALHPPTEHRAKHVRAIGEVAVATTSGIGLGAVGKTIHPYPTQAEVWKKLADAYNKTRLTPLTKKVLGTILKWRR